MTQAHTFTAAPVGAREIVITRLYDAPREVIFQTYVDPKLIPLWWGPRNVETVVDEMDVRPGGAWRFICRAPDGREDAFRGHYQEIATPDRLVFTFEWEGLPGHILTETITFEDLDGKTRLVDTSVFTSQEDRDGMLASGMEQGARDSMDRLEELLTRTSTP